MTKQTLDDEYSPLINYLSKLPMKYQMVFLVLEEDWYETVLGDGEYHYSKTLFFDSKSATEYKRVHDKRQVQTHHIRPGMIRLRDGVLEPDIEKYSCDVFSDWDVFKLAIERIHGIDPPEEDLSFTDGNYILPEVETFIPQETIDRADALIVKATKIEEENSLEKPRNSLHYTLCQVLINEQFPPSPYSDREKALIRMADTARLRKSEGTADSFLFVLIGCCDLKTAEVTIRAYGFKDAQFEVISPSEFDEEFSSPDYEESDYAATCIESWLLKEHPKVIAFTPKEYDCTHLWWSGIEFTGDTASTSEVRNEFPDEFRKQSETWQEILNRALCHQDQKELGIDTLYVPIISIYQACLCEWLHGFNAACKNNFNGFEAESIAPLLGLTESALYNELTRQSRKDAESLREEWDENGENISKEILCRLIEEVRYSLRSILSKYFGNDAALLWALYSVVQRPKLTP